MHVAEHQTDGGDAGSHAGCDRQQRHGHRHRRAEGQQQQHADHHRAGDRQCACTSDFDLRPALDREHRRAAQPQARAAPRSDRGERPAAPPPAPRPVRSGRRRRPRCSPAAPRAGRRPRPRRRLRCGAHAPGSALSAMRRVSPVGSLSSTGLIALPAGVPSSDRVSSMASRRPVGAEAFGVDRRAERVAVLVQPAADDREAAARRPGRRRSAPARNCTAGAHRRRPACARRRRAARRCRLRCRSTSVRAATPLCSCSISTR